MSAQKSRRADDPIGAEPRQQIRFPEKNAKDDKLITLTSSAAGSAQRTTVRILFKKNIAARVADHIVPHHGDSKLFGEGELQSLCFPAMMRRQQELKDIMPKWV